MIPQLRVRILQGALYHPRNESGLPLHGAKVFWLRARFNDYWQPTLQGEGPHAEKQYMDFIKKVYSICCYTNAQPEVFGTDIIPTVCHNRQTDLEKTVQNVEQVCKYFNMAPSKAKQITDLILWRIERLSRLFSGCFRHDPKQGHHRECRRPVDMGHDGSVELYDALGCITHANNFMGNKPGLLLMAMFPNYGKARFEIAFVYPSVDGPYNERKEGDALFQEIDGSTTSHPDPHTMHSGLVAENSSMIQRWSSM